MQFEVRGQSYFLQFHQGEGRWYLLKPTSHGIAGIPVQDDGAPLTNAILIPEDEPEHELVN